MKKITRLANRMGTFWAQCLGVNPSVETIVDWHTCRSMDFPIQTTSSPPEWSSVGEAEVGSDGDQPNVCQLRVSHLMGSVQTASSWARTSSFASFPGSSATG